jgi:porin
MKRDVGWRVFAATVLGAALLEAASPARAAAQGAHEVLRDEPAPPRLFRDWERLSGDWGGARGALARAGFQLNVVYTAEVSGNAVGGLQRGVVHLGNLDVQLTLGLEPMLGWSGATVFLYALGDYGHSPSGLVGDAQVVSNIDSGTLARLYEAWFEQALGQGAVSLRLGLYDLNSEFDTTNTAQLFFNSSHGIGMDFSQSGRAGPSIFPIASLGARLRLQPTRDTYLQAVVLDGEPEELLEIELSKRDGALIAVEVGFERLARPESSPFKVAVGFWRYTASFQDMLHRTPVDSPSGRVGNTGGYALGEGWLYREPDDPSQGLAVFARAGVADQDVNPFHFYLGAGVTYTGPWANRDADCVGLAAASAFTGSKYRRGMRSDASDPDLAEVALELTYLAQLTGWLSLQLDLQYVLNPGADGGVPNALYLGARAVLSL